MSPPPIRIAIVNDYEIVVAGTAQVLMPFSDRVDVVELDTRMPVQSKVDVMLYDSFGQTQGHLVDVTTLLNEHASRLVIFSWNVDEDLVDQALEAGASGYLSKALTAEELVTALEQVCAGDVVRPGAAREQEPLGRWPGDDLGLSAREAEVLALICQGLSNDDISERAFIGVNTIKTHIRSLYRKIGVASRTQAVLWGLDHGFRPDRARRILEN